MTKVLSRFLVFLLAVLAVVTVALTLFYFLRSEEAFSFSQGNDDNLVRYVNTGETLEVTVYRTKPSANTYTLVSSDESVLKFKERTSENVFLFETSETKGGRVEIKLQTSNTKFADLSLIVRVGNGTKSHPFYVRNYNDLSSIGKTEKFTLNANYFQVADIDMSVATENWVPIGGNGVAMGLTTDAFEGAYNGNGHYINNFTMLSDDTSVDTVSDLKRVASLFAKIGENGSVTKLNMDKVTIDGGFDYSAGLASECYGTVQFVNVTNLSINNTLQGSVVGGIIGVAVSNSTESTTSSEYVSKIMYSSVQGCITSASKYVGGIVGQSNALIMNNYAEIVINSTTTSADVGGIVGYNRASISSDTISAISKSCVINNYAIARITASQDSSCGAIIGSNVNTDNSSAIVLNPTTEIEKKYNRVYGNYYLSLNGDVVNGVGNIVDNSNAYITTGLTENQMKKYATANDLSKLNTEGAIIDKTLGYVTYNAKGEYVVWDFGKTWGLGVEFNSGFPYIKSNAVAKNEVIFNGISSSPDTPIDPTPDDPDKPKPTGAMTQAEFRALFEADLEANDGKQYTGSYLISRDVILTEAWVPIGTPEQPFNGKFIMAKGAVIHNLYIVDCGLKYYGLFGYVGAKASINGVSIEGVKIELDDSAEEDVVVGVLAGYSEAKYINGVMFSVLTAVNNKTYITASSENGFDKIAVSNKKSAVIGGVIGELADNKFAYDLHCCIGISAKNCNKNVVIGGVVGSNNGYIEMCSYDGNLNNSNSYNYVIEIMESSGATMYVGGVVGDNNLTISASKAMGKIVVPTADNVYVGGIAGYSKGSIEKSSASSMQINGGYYVGGIVGVVETNELLVGKGSVADFEGVTQSWASGTLTGKRVGGLAGKVVCGTISNCYTTVNVSGEKMAGFVVDLPRKSDTNCGKVKYCYSATTFNTSAGEAYWESASVIRQTNGWWAGNSKLAGYVENCIYNTHDNLAEESKKIDSIKRQYSYYILNQGMDCDDGRNSDENCKKVSTFTARGSGFNTSIWNLSDGSYPTLFNAK